jgi:hypothetical protein
MLPCNLLTANETFPRARLFEDRSFGPAVLRRYRATQVQHPAC